MLAIQVDPEIEKFKEVARREVDRGHGGFLTAFLEAFLKADNENSKILLPVMERLCQKYREKLGLGDSHTQPASNGLDRPNQQSELLTPNSKLKEQRT